MGAWMRTIATRPGGNRRRGQVTKFRTIDPGDGEADIVGSEQSRPNPITLRRSALGNERGPGEPASRSPWYRPFAQAQHVPGRVLEPGAPRRADLGDEVDG